MTNWQILTNFGIFLRNIDKFLEFWQILKNFGEFWQIGKFWKTWILTNYDKLANFGELRHIFDEFWQIAEFWQILKNCGEFWQIGEFWHTWRILGILTNSMNFDKLWRNLMHALVGGASSFADIPTFSTFLRVPSFKGASNFSNMYLLLPYFVVLMDLNFVVGVVGVVIVVVMVVVLWCCCWWWQSDTIVEFWKF